MNQKDLFEKLTNAVEALNSKVDTLQNQVNQVTAKQKANPFAAKKAGNQTNVKPPTEFDRHLYAATRKNYGDKDFKDAMQFFNNYGGRPLSMKQLGWITYYAGQNHPNCQAEVETFIKNELKRRTDYTQAKQDLIDCIKQSYSKFKNSHPDYFNGVIDWLNNL